MPLAYARGRCATGGRHNTLNRTTGTRCRSHTGRSCRDSASTAHPVLVAAAVPVVVVAAAPLLPLTFPTLVHKPAAAWKTDKSVVSDVDAHATQPDCSLSNSAGANTVVVPKAPLEAV